MHRGSDHPDGLSGLRRLVAQNLELLAQGRELIERLPDEVFCAPTPPMARSGVGSHFRHCLDYYHCFLDGVAEGRIDYDRRRRDAGTEADRAVAAEALARVARSLEALAEYPNGHSTVEVSGDTPSGDGAVAVWSRSSVERELQCLVAHTVHHFALIGLLLRAHGVDPGAGFGVAPSTLAHQRQTACPG